MSLTAYNTLTSNNKKNNNLAVTLATLTAGKLDINSENITVDKIAEKIANFNPQQGWMQYRDEVKISTTPPERLDIIDGQYCDNEKNSPHIKLLQGNYYLVTSFVYIDTNANYDTQDKEPKQLYSEQAIELRNNLKSSDTAQDNALYRLWYQQGDGTDNSEHEGRWLPLVQQFIGFDIKSNSSSNSNKENQS
ncbi:MAG: hypothetical protein JJW02_09100 [Pseudoalteromonas sp.]|nr:hypothetical protein [Pseudoalteromonas sp.]